VTLGPGESQRFAAAVFGINQTGVTWSINPAAGSIDSAGLYTAPATISTTQKITVMATSVFDTSVTGTATVNVQAPAAVTVTVAPATVTLTNSQTQRFTATVQNASNTAVAWSLSPQTGTVDSNGLYTAPALIGTSSKLTLTATSVADPSKSGTAAITLSPLVDVGFGAPTPGLQQQFVTAFYRNGFSTLVSLPPIANVRTLGSSGYIQEFDDAAKTSGAKLALATISPTIPSASAEAVITVVQLLADLYAYYNTVGVNTAGYPLMDTQVCPYFDSGNSCQYDFFDKSYVLFAYDAPLVAGQDFAINGAFYTEWTKLGGMSGGPGRPLTGQTSITSSTGVTATAQTFAQGAIYSITSGVNGNKTFGVVQPLYDLYVSQSGPLGRLGLPVSDLFAASTGAYRQKFEGGDLQYTGGGGPTVQLPVTAIVLSGGAANTTINLNLGQSVTVTATPVIGSGDAAPDRPVSWSTTNSNVISVQANGATATLTAVGGGSASVTAASQGVTSSRISFLVIAPCCRVGDGAPVSVQQSFQDALTRNRIIVRLPVASPASRAGIGYVQMVQANDDRGTLYILAQADQTGAAYLVGGSLLARYQALGGPGGSLGYPKGDATAGGTQTFSGGALSGLPVRVVTGPVLVKWALMGYDAGPAGYPLDDAAPFFSFGANSGIWQPFGHATIAGATAGPRAGQAFITGGLILARYAALGGPSGDFGMPTSDEFVNDGQRQQNFEGGTITYSPGDPAAVEHAAPKAPAIVVAPAVVSAGGRARLALAGFPNGGPIRVSLTGQPDFQIAPANGAYSWEMSIPVNAKSGVIAVHATGVSGAVADGSLSIRGFADNRVQISKNEGDNQTGLPGALLPRPLRLALTDSAGSPVAGVRVGFVPSNGVELSASFAVTDSAGVAQVFARLPSAEGIAAVTVEAPSIAQAPVTFYARAAGSTLANFPRFLQAGEAVLGNGSATIAQKGALLSAVASILRYRQNRGELSAPNGVADAATLNDFLKAWCSVDVRGARLCDGYLSNPDSGEQVVNLWRAAEFTGGVDIAISPATVPAVADLVAQGSPVLLSLALSRNGAPAGGHFVVAIGVAANGAIVIHDPNPFFARASLAEYLRGFTAGGANWAAELRGAADLSLRAASATRFMLAALSQSEVLLKLLAMDIQSASGACGAALDLGDALDAAGASPTRGPLVSRLRVCSGNDSTYQLAVGAAQPFRARLIDLAAAGTSFDLSGSAAAAYRATRSSAALTLEPLAAVLTAGGIVDAATFSAGIAPGGLAAIFGSGLAGPGSATTVDFDGTAATVLSATPFQVNIQVPISIGPGRHTARVQSPYGTAQQDVAVDAQAPRIFLVGGESVPAILNQDYTLNSPENPATRGRTLIIYANGLGPVTVQGSLSVVDSPVSAVVNGKEVSAAFAGFAPGFIGLYQVNVLLPTSIPPGLGISLTLRQGGQLSNAVFIGIQ
jgi:uncharacterized protein (TIGR03437 family)